VSPVTTRRRRARRADSGRRAVAPRRAAQAATLFDAPPKGPTTHVAPPPPAAIARVAAPPPAPAQGGAGRDRGAEREGCAPGSGETLDRLVVGGWERLTSRATTQCLLCGGTMEPTYGVQSKPIGGRCRDCGTTLS
jgi:hypothetical protein